MKRVFIVLGLASSLLATAAMGASNDWWHSVHETASSPAPADHNQVCATAEKNLRTKYSDVTSVRLHRGWDMYTRTLYCTAYGQSQQ